MANQSEAQNNALNGASSTHRKVLPVPEPQYPPITEIDVQNATAPPRFQVKAPKGAPNVVVILLDNFGFGVVHIRRPYRHANVGTTGPGRASLQQLQGAPAVFAQPHGLAHWAQQP